MLWRTNRTVVKVGLRSLGCFSSQARRRPPPPGGLWLSGGWYPDNPASAFTMERCGEHPTADWICEGSRSCQRWSTLPV